MRLFILAGMLWWTCRACGRIRREPQRYARYAWFLSLTIYAAMLVQEGVLLRAGLLTWANGLPLHLCSLLGLLTPLTLLTRSRMLRSAAFFLGIPGAALALIFPAVLHTPWPRLTAAAFHTLHAGLFCAPWLARARGWRPVPADALRAGVFLVMAAALAMVVNPLTGGNYLFLAAPVPGTPLAWLGQWGIWPYRGLLAACAAFLLLLEAGLLCVRR